MKRLCLLLAPALLLCASGLAAKEVRGTVTLQLKNFFGYQNTGPRKPSADKLCKAKFGNLAGPAKTTYNIDPQTNIMSAETTFHSTKYDLSPEGLVEKYMFANSQTPLPPIYAVRFMISLQFTNPHSFIGVVLDADTNCVLTDMNKMGMPQ